MTSLLRKIDDAVYRGERVVAAMMFLIMGSVMFINVMYRVFAGQNGPLSRTLLSILTGLGFSPDPKLIHGPVSLVVSILLVFGIGYIAVRTVKRETPISKQRSLAHAAVVAVVAAGSVKLLLLVFPNGLIWGPAIALACMLWVGFLGASMATYEKRHLALEMGEKIWPEAALRYVKALALAITALATIFLLSLAVLSWRSHFGEWSRNHLVGQLTATEIPVWAVFTIFPYTFVVMTVRWIAQSVRTAQGHIDEAVDSEVMAAEVLVGQSREGEGQ